jgi:hypothetical protein
MRDPAEQLQALYAAGFDLQTFDRFPRAIGVLRGSCIVLLQPGSNGLEMVGRPGWRMGEVLGVLTELKGRQVFQAKAEIIDATPERQQELNQFANAVRDILAGSSQ